MGEKLKLIKSELNLHPDTPMLTALKRANEAMTTAEGPIPAQVDRLMKIKGIADRAPPRPQPKPQVAAAAMADLFSALSRRPPGADAAAWRLLDVTAAVALAAPRRDGGSG